MTDQERQRMRALKAKKRKKKVLIIEIVIIAALSLVLGFSIWATQKLSLVHRREVNTEQLKTADTYNASVTVTPSPVQEQESEQVPGAITPVPTGGTENNYVTEQMDGMDIIALVGLDTRLTADDGENSDTMMLCCINHNDRTIKLVSIYRDTLLNLGEYYDGTPDYYAKANEAYNIGGPTQFLSMVNLNMDLNLTEYITIDFRALAYAIDILGGLDVDMTRAEIVHMNNYNVETSKVCEVPYEELEIPDDVSFDGARTRTFHLTGTQAVSYARIRYTEGGDYRRASRQREILTLVKDKAMDADLGTIDSLLNTVLPYVTTNLDNAKILSLATNIISYDMDQSDASGFPMVRQEDDGAITGTDCIIPVTLEYNVSLLHNYIFGDTGYYPSYTVQEYSDHIVEISGFGEDDIEATANIDYHDALGTWTPEGEAAAAAAAAETEYSDYENDYDSGYDSDSSDSNEDDYTDDSSAEEEQNYEESDSGEYSNEEYSSDENNNNSENQ